MRARSLLIGSAVLAVAASGLVGSSASATPPGGVTILDPTVPVKAELAGPVKAKSHGISLKTTGDIVVRDFLLTYSPGASSGWHKHPGVVVATVQSGSIQRTLACGAPQTFTAGQAFIEVGVHRVKNITSTPATLAITQMVPADTAADHYRIDVDRPTCPPHH
jgi:quercetin dioxygenase-like cupin family protein